MDAVSRENRRDAASRIAQGWGLNNEQIEHLLDQPEQVTAVISIHDSLQVIFSEEKDRANSWITKANKVFDGKSALEIIINGDAERIRKYLKYHTYNA